MNSRTITALTLATVAGLGVVGVTSASALPTATATQTTNASISAVDTTGIGTAVAEKMQTEAAIRAAVAEKMQAEAAAAEAAAAAPAAATGGAATTDAAAWASSPMAMRVKACESGHDYTINTGNGFYGAWQFALPSWLANGGGAFAPRPDLAPAWAQDQVAFNYYQVRGWAPWSCA